MLLKQWIPLGTLAGFFLGIAADILLLKGLVGRARKLSQVFWGAVFLFYTIGVFGFFMSVPIFNALLAIPAGFVVAATLAAQAPESMEVERAARRTAWFTTGVLLAICIASATIALLSSSTASDLKGMLGLDFDVTQAMILGLILVGGVGLLVFNWALAWGSTRLAYRFLRPASQRAVAAS